MIPEFCLFMFSPELLVPCIAFFDSYDDVIDYKEQSRFTAYEVYKRVPNRSEGVIMSFEYRRVD